MKVGYALLIIVSPWFTKILRCWSVFLRVSFGYLMHKLHITKRHDTVIQLERMVAILYLAKWRRSPWISTDPYCSGSILLFKYSCPCPIPSLPLLQLVFNVGTLFNNAFNSLCVETSMFVPLLKLVVKFYVHEHFQEILYYFIWLSSAFGAFVYVKGSYFGSIKRY